MLRGEVAEGDKEGRIRGQSLQTIPSSPACKPATTHLHRPIHHIMISSPSPSFLTANLIFWSSPPLPSATDILFQNINMYWRTES